MREIGRPTIGIHARRHTCASLLIAQGAPIKAIQAQLGHKSAELTLNRYGHLYPDEVDALAARLDNARAAALRGRPSPPDRADSRRYPESAVDRDSPPDLARNWHDEPPDRNPGSR